MNRIAAKTSSVVSAFVMVLASVLITLSSNASALQLTTRSLTLGSSAPNASTTYKFDFNTTTTATFQSFQAEICDTASGTCNAPSGLVTTSSTLNSTDLSGT